MNFVAIDFETANRDPASACAMGVAIVENGIVTDQRHWLIRPLDLSFDYRHIKKHGITPDMVEHAPTFKELWNDVSNLLNNQTLVAHNASFDINVLRNASSAYNIELPDYKSVCTVELSKKAWPGSSDYKLSTIAKFLSIELDHHHADSDAYASAMIAINACSCLCLKSINDCFDCLDLRSLYPASIPMIGIFGMKPVMIFTMKKIREKGKSVPKR